ncbi:MAG: hypothetical protein PHF56_21265 [Desulfuromonadaceae bacterium]|nr:hypothetical protein [Desulfuromonadaceae bacterium]
MSRKLSSQITVEWDAATSLSVPKFGSFAFTYGPMFGHGQLEGFHEIYGIEVPTGADSKA